MRSDFKLWIRFYYSRGFCPRTATLNCWRWFCSLQLELARQSYINRKIKTCKRCLAKQKTLPKFMHHTIVFVKLESSVIELSESVPWSRRCRAISTSVWNEILLGSQGTVNQTTSCQHTRSKKLVQHIGEVRSW